MENWLVNSKLMSSQWGIFRYAKDFVQCPQFIIQARQCHNRYKLNKANEAKSRFRNVLDIMRHPGNYRPNNCAKGMYFNHFDFYRVGLFGSFSSHPIFFIILTDC